LRVALVRHRLLRHVQDSVRSVPLNVRACSVDQSLTLPLHERERGRERAPRRHGTTATDWDGVVYVDDITIQ
jgi:hypothetical protein